MSFLDNIKPFVFGGLAGMTATACIQPIDTVKVRIQISGEGGKAATTNPLSVGRSIMASEGIRGLYKGLDSALFRQITYGTARLGTFTFLMDKYKKANPGAPAPGLLKKMQFAITAGVFGCMVGNPSDLVLVRFQGDSTLPPELRRNYRNVFDAFRTIIKEEGLFTLWRGSSVTMGRAIAITCGQLTTFGEFKTIINNARGQTKDDILGRALASTCSGVVCSTCSLPFDNLKTKLQKMKADKNGVNPYNGLFDCFRKSVATEGVTGLWVGLPTYIIRIAPHSIISLIVLDYLKYYFMGGQQAEANAAKK
jgi:solute carrier family 25 oxoglutarate transporter 11